MITVIIPVLNEEATISQTLDLLPKAPEIELIIVDGGSTDQTVEIVRSLGIKVIESHQKKRAYQMNIGAKIAQGEILLFLHADTQLPPNFSKYIIETLAKPEVIVGAFQLTIDSPLYSRRIIEKLVNLRSNLFGLPYGDQALFIKKEEFIALGGFADLPIMEDFQFIKKAQNQGKIGIVPVSVITSDRRWRKLGIWQTTIINQMIILGYYLGISPDKLAYFYTHQRLFR